ncbi:MAG: alginate export family protein [Burkholderiales bacterium]
MVCRHRGAALLLAILLFLPAESGRGDETKSAPVNLFGTHRFDEDFTYLKDPSRGTELVGQFGDFGDADIRAWTVASAFGFTFGDLPLKPRLGLHADIASGDDDPNDGTLRTFNAMLPKLNYLTEPAPSTSQPRG